ncbi:MAG: family 16 glycosylhydrolase [Porticoccaceae bacterium]|nr:family 16 glycosylhydrolase [Porticoccaceae bacterium]
MNRLRSLFGFVLISTLLVGGCSGGGSKMSPDTVAPLITLLGDASVSIEQGSTYSDAGAAASDNIDGDISANITIVNPVDVNTVGTYEVRFNVSDAAGNAATQVIRTVTVTASGGEGTDKWSLIWSDEFDGSAVDLEKWSYMIGDGTAYGEARGWGNDEKQYYTEDPANSGIAEDDGNTVLYIDATSTPSAATEYASAKLTTEDLFEFRFGKVEARIKLPYSKGIWPAFWMLGANKPDIGWPGSGEIDIVEMVGNAEQTVHGTVHYVNSGNDHRSNGNSKTISQGKYSDDYHVYAIEWSPEKIKWLVDGEQYYQVDIASDMKEFLRDHYLILNVAVGGYWPGYPDSSTVLPQRMAVDYVRVYRDTTLVNVPAAPELVAEEETMGLATSDALAAINSSFAPFQNIKIVTYGPGSPDPTVSTVAAEGPTSILASYPGGVWGGLYFELDTPIDATEYATGNLVVMLDVPEEIVNFEVKLEGAQGVGSLNLLDYTPQPVDNVYEKYTIPLADFMAQGTTLSDMKIPFALWNPMNADGGFVAGNILIDNIYFELAD